MDDLPVLESRLDRRVGLAAGGIGGAGLLLGLWLDYTFLIVIGAIGLGLGLWPLLEIEARPAQRPVEFPDRHAEVGGELKHGGPHHAVEQGLDLEVQHVGVLAGGELKNGGDQRRGR